MSATQKPELEILYKQFKLGDLPILQNQQRISIQKLFKILTVTKLKDLPTIEAMNFYLYCNFFKNRLLYSEIFRSNLAYLNLESSELIQRIKLALDKFDKMLTESTSESDNTWIDNNIAILHDGLVMLKSVPTRCNYYDKKVTKYLNPDYALHNKSGLLAIEAECATEFAQLSALFSQVGQIIGREYHPNE